MMFDQVKFGKRLRRMRKRAGMTMQHVAQCVYTSTSIISRYENGLVLPAIDRLYALSKLYGCSIDWLCGMEDEV